MHRAPSIAPEPRIYRGFSFLELASDCIALLAESAYGGVYKFWTGTAMVYMMAGSTT